MKCECGADYREVTEVRSFRIHGHDVTVNANLLRCAACEHAIWTPGQADAVRKQVWNAVRDREGR